LGEHDGRFTEEHRSRMVRWLLRELAETTDEIAKSAGAPGGTGGDWTELVAACDRLRPTVERWLAGLEQRIGEQGTGATQVAPEAGRGEPDLSDVVHGENQGQFRRF